MPISLPDDSAQYFNIGISPDAFWAQGVFMRAENDTLDVLGFGTRIHGRVDLSARPLMGKTYVYVAIRHMTRSTHDAFDSAALLIHDLQPV